jgi:GGDEF domain-containing protein
MCEEHAFSEVSLYDGLMGLAKRTSLLEHLDDAILRSRRSGRVVAMLFADLEDVIHVEM